MPRIAYVQFNGTTRFFYADISEDNGRFSVSIQSSPSRYMEDVTYELSIKDAQLHLASRVKSQIEAFTCRDAASAIARLIEVTKEPILLDYLTRIKPRNWEYLQSERLAASIKETTTEE